MRIEGSGRGLLRHRVLDGETLSAALMESLGLGWKGRELTLMELLPLLEHLVQTREIEGLNAYT
jgi:hypothetical protein